jgi:hypothetical protein
VAVSYLRVTADHRYTGCMKNILELVDLKTVFYHSSIDLYKTAFHRLVVEISSSNLHVQEPINLLGREGIKPQCRTSGGPGVRHTRWVETNVHKTNVHKTTA